MSDDPYLDGIMKRVPERAEQSQTPLASNPSTVYPDCMQGPSEPCAGYTQLLNHAEAHRREAERLTKALRIAEIKASGTLANNLCPDHRDKQTGKPCLACEIERLRGERDEAREAYTDENLQKHGLIGKYGRMRVLLREAKQSVLKAADADCVCVDGPQRCKYCLPHRALAERIDAALSGASPAVETSERQEISRLRHAIRKIRAHTAYRPGATPEFLAELLSSIARIASAAWHDFDDVKPDAEVALNAEHPWRAEIERLRALCAESQALMSEDFPERAEDLDRACASPRYLAHYKALLRELSDSPLKAGEKSYG